MTAAHCRAAFFLGLSLTIFWDPARAKPVTIDDTGTTALSSSVRMRWKTAMPARSGRANPMIGSMSVRVHINVTPWLKHSGRIFLNFPVQPPGPMGLTWTTQGRFLPGQVQSGNRALVYAGLISSPFMEDTLTFQFMLDGSLMSRAVPVSYHFEMEED